MQTAVTRFLEYLRVERNASELTVKSYGEDLTALVEYLAECYGPRRRARATIGTADLRGYLAALHEAELRQNHHRPAAGLAAQFLSLRPARRLGQDQSGQAAAQSAQAAVAAPFSVQRRHGADS